MTDKQAAAKDWLNRNFNAYEEVRALKMKLREMRAGAGNLTSRAEEVKVQKQPNPKAIENEILAIVEFANIIQQKEKTIFASDLETARVINELSEVKEKTILIYRYLCFLPWEQIAKRMNFSVNYCQELHMRALDHIYEHINFTIT